MRLAAGLRTLSREQMTAVLNHLEAALKAPDEATATAEQRGAYQKHREIVASLRGMLVKLDTLKSLDQAADRLTRYARGQHDLHLQSVATDNRSGNRRRGVDDREENADIIRRIEAKVYAYNALSINSLKRHGFQQEGILRQAGFQGGQACDVVVFGILKEEIEAVRRKDGDP